MNISLKFIGALLFLSASSHAQKNIGPTVEDIAFAKKTRELYTKDDVAILESFENISFGTNSNASKVTVKSTVKEKLMNINHRADIRKYEFYDSESKIETFSLKFKNDKNADLKIIDEFYKDKDLFYNDARVKHVALDFPVQGYSYNYELEKTYEDVKYFTSLYFNDEFPVLKKKISITVPDWLNVELKEFNFAGNSIEKKQIADPKQKATIYEYTMNNIDGYHKENNAPGRSYLYPHIIVIAKSFQSKGAEKTLFNTTKDLYSWYKSLVDSMKDDTAVLANKVNELTATAKTDEEKIKNIYYWVQDNIRYIAFEDGIAGFKPDESNHVFEKRYGDCKGMANLTKQMLKLAGFDARLTWIGTKHISYDYTTPSLAVDNHMICTLFHNGKKYFLDGTEKFNSFGEYAERIQNKEVMIENGDVFIIDKVPSAKSDFNKERYTASLSIEDDKLKGLAERNYLGESRSLFLYSYNMSKSDKKEEALEKYLSANDKNIEIENIQTSDLNNRDIPLQLNFGIAIDNKVSRFDNDIYVDLEYLNDYKNFDLKDRKTNFEFDYKRNHEAVISLKIPDGYKVSQIPENLLVKEKDYDIAITFEENQGEIIYKKTFNFNNGVIKSSEISQWNSVVKKLSGIYNKQIILSKI